MKVVFSSQSEVEDGPKNTATLEIFWLLMALAYCMIALCTAVTLELSGIVRKDSVPKEEATRRARTAAPDATNAYQATWVRSILMRYGHSTTRDICLFVRGYVRDVG
jgi:hypothetical protein